MSGSAGRRPTVVPAHFGVYQMETYKAESVGQEQSQSPPPVGGTPETSQNGVMVDNVSDRTPENIVNEPISENVLVSSEGDTENNNGNSDVGNAQDQGHGEDAITTTLPHPTQQYPDDSDDDDEEDVFKADEIAQLIATARNTLDSAHQATDMDVKATQHVLDAYLRAIKLLTDQVGALTITSREVCEGSKANVLVSQQAFNCLFGVLDDNAINDIRRTHDIETNPILINGVNYQKDMKIQTGRNEPVQCDTKRNETKSSANLTEREYPRLQRPSAPTSSAAMALGLTGGLGVQQPSTLTTHASAVTPANGTRTDQGSGMTETDEDRQRERQLQHQVRLQAQELIRKKEDKERREKNIIIKGLHETDREGDWRAIQQLLNYLGCPRRIHEIVKFDRIGNLRQGRNRSRLLIIEFTRPSAAYEMWCKAPKLKFDSFFGSVYIQKDLSREERTERYNNRRRNGFDGATGGAGPDGGAGSRGGSAGTGSVGGGNGGRGGASTPPAGPQVVPRRPPRQTQITADISNNLNQNQGNDRANTATSATNADENISSQEMMGNESTGPRNRNGTNGNGGGQSGNGGRSGGHGED